MINGIISDYLFTFFIAKCRENTYGFCDIPQPVWAAAFGLAQTPCNAWFDVSSFRRRVCRVTSEDIPNTACVSFP